ncbi:MAG: hypothetical protein J1E96_00460 [Ruminococcus sp.]|nr:hypothetical protein [Ruminococcus sp.]
MTKNETIKGIIGIFLSMLVGLNILIGFCFNELIKFCSIFFVFLYIFQIAVVPYAHRFLHNKKWYTATLITLCVLNIFYCAIFAGIIVSIKSSGNPWAELGVFVMIIILIPMLVITSAIIIASIISYNKRKGSFN